MSTETTTDGKGSLRARFRVFEPLQSSGLWGLCEVQAICTSWWNAARPEEPETWFPEGGIRVIVLKIRLKCYPCSSLEKDVRAQNNNELKGICCFHQCERWRIPACLQGIERANVVFLIHLFLRKLSLFSTNSLLLFHPSARTSQIHISCLLGNMGHVASILCYLSVYLQGGARFCLVFMGWLLASSCWLTWQSKMWFLIQLYLLLSHARTFHKQSVSGNASSHF